MVIGLSGQFAAVDENLTGRENLWMFGRLYQLSRAEAVRRADEILEPVRPVGRRRPGRQDLLGRHEAPARPRERADRSAQAAVPGRAHDRARSPEPARDVGRHPRPGPRGRDAAAHDPVPRGGGRARGHDRRRRPRQDHRDRHGRRAEGPGGRRANRGRRSRARSHPARDARCWPASARAPSRSTTTPGSSRCPTSRGAAALTQVVRELDEAGIRIDDIGLRRPTLDEVFLSLTGHATDEEDAA